MPRTIVDLTASSPPSSTSTGSRLLTDPMLRQMIDTASLDRVRLTLRAICTHSTTASDTARSLLFSPQVLSTKEKKVVSESSAEEEEEDEAEEEDEDVDEDEEEELDEKREVITNRMVKRARFAVCQRCLEDFDVNSKRRAHECVSHSGTKEVDWYSDVWCDWDEECYGNIEDQGDEYPEGFTYTCYGEPGDVEGCRVGRHKEYDGEGRPSKRVRR